VQSDWQGADLASLARQQLEPYVRENPGRLRMEGEPVLLPADLATPFGLVLHELATNAFKHGSLSRPAGSVDVSWTVAARDGQRFLKLRWRETSSALVPQPATAGLGTLLIENAIPSAIVRREFDAQGCACTIEVSLADGDRETSASHDPAHLEP